MPCRRDRSRLLCRSRCSRACQQRHDGCPTRGAQPRQSGIPDKVCCPRTPGPRLSTSCRQAKTRGLTSTSLSAELLGQRSR
jgi:hypothetical protein